jgi:Domain of unknown function (DUF4388)
MQQQSRFVILTGHLKDYPLSDLVGILRHQRKTGRLLIEYPKGPASFYFRDGELVDAQLDNLSGLQAVCVAVVQPASSFNFNPLIQPPKRSIENSMQRVVSELLGCWDENGLEIDAIAPSRSGAQPALAVQPAPQPALLAAGPSFNISQTTRTDQALVFSSVALEVPKSNYNRVLLTMAASGLMMLGLSTVIAITRGFGARPAASVPAATTVPAATSENKEIAAVPEPVLSKESDPVVETSKKVAASFPRDSNRKPTTAIPKQENSSSTGSDQVAAANPIKEEAKPVGSVPRVESVRVIVRIDNGRVAEASVANHQPGMAAYEALALRIARQRRYPNKSTGSETVVIKVTPSN